MTALHKSVEGVRPIFRMVCFVVVLISGFWMPTVLRPSDDIAVRENIESGKKGLVGHPRPLYAGIGL